MLMFWMLGCSPIELSVQVEVGLPSSSSTVDSGQAENVEFVEGDAITVNGINGLDPSENIEEPAEMVEWFDAAILSENVGVLAGQGG